MKILIALLMLLAMPAGASAQSGLSEGGVSSANVEWLAHYEDTFGVAEGGRLVGRTFFLTNNNQGLFSFDVSTPEAPKQLGHLPLVHGAENEDVATNGRILLLSQLGDVYHLTDGVATQGHWLNVIDVRDPANMVVLAQVQGAGDHTWDCLYDCTWAYSSSGHVLDLRDPAQPVLHQGLWRAEIGLADLSPGFSHDVTEVAPGFVMVATTPMLLLDTRDPLKPRIIAKAPEDSENAHHNVVWPRHMADKFIVTASESQHLGRCETYSSAKLQVWEATDWARTGTFVPAGSYKPVNGTQADGNPPASATWYGCSAHWAETHPSFHNGGLISGAFYSHGAKLLDVDADGEIAEVGWFLAHGAGASAVYWITDRVLYVADDTRGLDVIRYTGPLPPPPVEPPAVRPPASSKEPLRDTRAPKVTVRVKRLRRGRAQVSVRCDEDCWARVGARRFALRRGVIKRVTVRSRSVRVVVEDRAGNRRVVRRKVR